MSKRPLRTFQDLLVWQKAHSFVLKIYALTSRFPAHELYGLTSQLRRAAVSIAANIAEGSKKRGQADKVRFLNISQGSLEESRYYLILANDLGYALTEELSTELEEISIMLHAFIKSISSNTP